MPYMVTADDKPGTADLRFRVRPSHIAYLGKLIAAGAKMEDDGVTATGSLYVIDTDSREEAERFVADDPFMKEGVFAGFVATRWRKAIVDGRSFILKG
jgi:uncharacterized protein YciI